MSLTLGLNAALTGLMSSQRQLDIAANNIANVNTAGYVRKEAAVSTRTLAGQTGGVQVTGELRSVDEKLLKDLRLETASAAKYQVLDDMYSRLQSLFGRPGDNSSISHLITDVATAMEALAVNPSKAETQGEAVENLVRVAEQVNTLSKEIQNLRLECDDALAQSVERANELLSEIASLNDQIALERGRNGDFASLLDKRDNAMNELAGLLGVQTFAQQDGGVTIATTEGVSLLGGVAFELQFTEVASVSAITSYSFDQLSGITVNNREITSQITTGKIGALLQMRDQTLPAMQSELDELTSQLKDQLNLVHNRGSSYPNPTQEMTGTRTFLAPTDQSIEMTDGDTAIVLYDSNGEEIASTTLRALMRSGLDGGAATFDGAGGSWKIDSVAGSVCTKLEAWLQANGAASATVGVVDGKAVIDLGQPGIGVSFRDQRADVLESKAYSAVTDVPGVAGALTIHDAAGDNSIAINAGDSVNAIFGKLTLLAAGLPDMQVSLVEDQYGVRIRVTNSAGEAYAVSYDSTALQNALGFGAERADVSIDFDQRGDSTGAGTTNDLTGLQGFSNFFGFNDLYIDDRTLTAYEAEPVASTWRWTGGAVTLQFDTAADFNTGITVNVANGQSLAQIAASIDALDDYRAEVVPDGNGQRLRITNSDGVEFQIVESYSAASAPPNSFMESLGLQPAAVGISTSLYVREDIASDPSLLSRGTARYNPDSGQFSMTTGDNTVANELAAAFKTQITFRRAGSISSSTLTLGNYASSLVSGNARGAATATRDLEYHQGLKDSVNNRLSAKTGVNLDEEMAQITLFQQAYAASARVISVTQQLMQTLNDIIR